MTRRIGGLLAFLLLMIPVDFAYAQSFQGNLDSANSTTCTVSGWSRDSQNPAPIQVRIYQDGNATTGTPVTTFISDLLRTDLTFVDKNHGFNQSLADYPALADGRDHTIYAYGVSGNGASAPLSGNGRILRCAIRSVVVTPPATILVSGQSMQLDAVAIDFAGKPRSGDRFNFTSSNSSVISVSASGVVTAKNPGIASVTANVQGTNSNSAAVLLQVTPSQIDVAGGGLDMRVGELRQFSAVALDVNSAPIPGVTFNWRITGANGGQINAAAIDSTTGLMTTNGNGLITVHAEIRYSGQSPAHLSIFEGTTTVTVKAGSEFKLTRILTNSMIDRSLALRPAYNSEPAINDLGQIAFTANLDGLGSALMLYDNGNFEMLASAGTPGPLGGYIWHFEGPPAINNRGDVLVRVGTTFGWGLLRASKSSGLSFFLENATAEGFARMSGLNPGRNSLNDRGDMLFAGNYMPVGATAFQQGLFLLNDTSFRIVWSAADPLPGFPANFIFDISNSGLDRNGVAYFRVISGNDTAIFRADGESAPVKIAGTGTIIGNPALGGIQLQAVNTMAVSPNGTIAFHVTGSNKVGIVRLRSGQSELEFVPQSSIGQVLSVNDSGETLYVGDPGVAPWWGLYTWVSATLDPKQSLRFGDTAPGAGPNVLEGGELPNWARTGKITANREVYVSLDSTTNHLLMARLAGNGTTRTLWKTGTTLTAQANLNFLGLVPGAETGPVHVFGGGGNASILEAGPSGTVRKVWAPGDQPTGGVGGTILRQATKNLAGDVFVTFDDGIIRFRNGSASSVVRFPMADRDNVIVRAPSGWYDGNNWLSVNSAGTFVVNTRADDSSRLELFSQGTLTPLVIQGGANQTVSPGGGKFSGLSNAPFRQNAVLIDERGRVMMNAQVTGGPSGLFIYENGQWKSAALTGVTRIGGALITTIRSMRVAGESFYAHFDLANGLDTLVAQYDGQNWIPLIRRFVVLPDGTSLNTFGNASFAVNRKGDIVYLANANALKIVLRTADGVNHLVYTEMALTDDGDRLPNQGLEIEIRDNGEIYVAGFDANDRSVVYKASASGSPPLSYSIPNSGGISVASSGASPTVKVGYAKVQASPGSATPSGLAIFGVRQNQILVSEASVPASPAIKSGRTYAEVSPTVNTGLAIANPNNRDASISFYFTDLNGANFGAGTTTIPAGGKITAFLDQAPFNGGASLKGTFTFNSSDPIAVIALRGLTNERGEFLITTLPITDLSIPAVSSTVVFPDFADGGGWTTQVILLNPGETVLTGSVQFADQAGALTAVTVNGQSNSSFSYSIPARGSFKLQTAGSAAIAVSGSVRVVPAGSSVAPSGLAIFSLRAAGVTVTEVGVLAQSTGNAFRLYAESAGTFGAVGSIQSGLAVTNNTASTATVTLELTRLDGSSTGLSGTVSVPANGQIATFLNQIPGFAALKAFQGVLRVTSAASISVVGLRGRYNERGEFLASSTPPVNESSAPSSAPVFFPQIADGGGYTTQFILFNGQPGLSSGGMEVFSESGGSLNLTLR